MATCVTVASTSPAGVVRSLQLPRPSREQKLPSRAVRADNGNWTPPYLTCLNVSQPKLKARMAPPLTLKISTSVE